MTAQDEAVRLYSVAKLALLWDVSKDYIYDEINAKRLPAVQLGNGDRNKMRVSATDAAEWIAAHRLAAAS